MGIFLGTVYILCHANCKFVNCDMEEYDEEIL